jgi:putative DNA primase/helicase
VFDALAPPRSRYGEMMPDTDILEAALGYALRGLHVFPAREKVPATPHGHLDATTDPVIIREWFARMSSANLAIASGARSGLVVLDVDPRHGGDDALADLEHIHRVLPETPRVLTGGGGVHIYFAHPGATVSCSAGVLGAGLDVRGDGGYVIAPPSVHASGRPYAWQIGASLEDISLAPPPVWLLERLTSPNPHRVHRDGELLALGAGSRNGTLTRVAGALRRYGIGQAALADSLRAINREHCTPPLPEHEIERIAASVARYRPAGSVPETFGGPSHHRVEVA